MSDDLDIKTINSQKDISQIGVLGSEDRSPETIRGEETGSFDGETVSIKHTKNEGLPTEIDEGGEDPDIFLFQEQINKKCITQQREEERTTFTPSIQKYGENLQVEPDSLLDTQKELAASIEGDSKDNFDKEIQDKRLAKLMAEKEKRKEKAVNKFVSRIDSNAKDSQSKKHKKYQRMMTNLELLCAQKDINTTRKILEEKFPNVSEKTIERLISGENEKYDFVLEAIASEFADPTEQHNVLECLKSWMENELKEQPTPPSRAARIKVSIQKSQTAIDLIMKNQGPRIEAGYELNKSINDIFKSQYSDEKLPSKETIDFTSQILDEILSKKSVLETFKSLIKDISKPNSQQKPISSGKQLEQFKKNVDIIREVLGRELKTVNKFVGKDSETIVLSVRNSLDHIYKTDSIYKNMFDMLIRTQRALY